MPNMLLKTKKQIFEGAGKCWFYVFVLLCSSNLKQKDMQTRINNKANINNYYDQDVSPKVWTNVDFLL